MSYPQPAKQAAAYAYNAFKLVAWTVGTIVSHVGNVALQLQDARGNNLAQIAAVKLYLSDSSDGHTLTAVVPTSNLAIGTNGVILGSLTTNEAIEVITNALGQVDINITQTATHNYYLVAVLPDGGIVVSPIIAFP